MKDEAEQVIEARSDVDRFSTVGEALNEAILRADGAAVFIHSKDNSQEQDFENGDACFCHPARVESKGVK